MPPGENHCPTTSGGRSTQFGRGHASLNNRCKHTGIEMVDERSMTNLTFGATARKEATSHGRFDHKLWVKCRVWHRCRGGPATVYTVYNSVRTRGTVCHAVESGTWRAHHAANTTIDWTKKVSLFWLCLVGLKVAHMHATDFFIHLTISNTVNSLIALSFLYVASIWPYLLNFAEWDVQAFRAVVWNTVRPAHVQRLQEVFATSSLRQSPWPEAANGVPRIVHLP